MCTTFTLTYITCGHSATSHRPSNNAERCAADPQFHTYLEREGGRECWDCDPDQTPVFYPADTRKDEMQDRKDKKDENIKNDEKDEAKKRKADDAEQRL